MLVLSAVGLAATSCAAAAHAARHDPIVLEARTHPPAPATSVLAGSPAVLAADVAEQLFAAAPVVVVANASDPADLPAAAARAARAHAPLLLTSPGTAAPSPSASAPSPRASAPSPGASAPSGSASPSSPRASAPPASVTAPSGSAAIQAAVRALHPRAVLAVGLTPAALAAQLPGIRGVHVTASLARLPATRAPAPLPHVVLLVPRSSSGAVATAIAATAQVAGARVIAVRGYDPRADPRAIAALAAAKPRQVLAVGARFGAPGLLAARVAVAETGVQLPGGGQVLFPMRRLVALYGNPGTPSLGALGEQGLYASIARARQMAAPYRPLSRVPVVPTFEIIATVAQGSPGPNGLYSYETPLSVLRPWVRAATRARMYVVLDLQPGRASLLAEAKQYQALLERPNVGLALDPEWALGPGQVPLKQIGSVSITEVNSVINWLAALTARYRLPQKLLVLHQFRLSMIQGEQRLNTRHDDLAIVIHMDGQGTPADKQQTWDAVTGAAPPGVFFGWKNFLVKDHPMLTPQETMAHFPQPVMISYQ
jgi:hypothetical protein